MPQPLEPLQYYKWLWRDWRGNRRVQRMSWAARGLYRELLDEQWAEGSIPCDLPELASICGCPDHVMREYWPEIESCFHVREDGRLVNSKMERQRTELDSKRVKLQDSGRLGGKAKSAVDHQRPLPLANATPLPSHGQNMPYSRAEQSMSREEQSTHTAREAAPTQPPKVIPPSPSPRPEPAAPTAPVAALLEVVNAEAETLVQKICVSHPRSLARKQRFNEAPWSHKTAVMDAARDEVIALGCSLMAALEMMLQRVEIHAREIPPGEHRYLKDVPQYFALHEYRMEPEEFRRNDGKRTASATKTGGTIDALAQARAFTRGRAAPGGYPDTTGEAGSPSPSAP